jgi:hypothetical protein
MSVSAETLDAVRRDQAAATRALQKIAARNAPLGRALTLIHPAIGKRITATVTGHLIDGAGISIRLRGHGAPFWLRLERLLEALV